MLQRAACRQARDVRVLQVRAVRLQDVYLLQVRDLHLREEVRVGS